MRTTILLAVAGCLSGSLLFSGQPAGDPVMGNWKGYFRTDTWDTGTLRAQVIALGNNQYRAVFDVRVETGEAARAELPGQTENGKTVFAGKIDLGYDMGGVYDVTAEVVDSTFTGKFSGYEYSGTFELKKEYVKSPTLGAKPPQGAVVLFDGSSLDAWQHKDGKPASWKILPDGSLEVTKGDIFSKQKFGDAKIHVEFRTPFMPDKTGQDRGNSGVYVHGRYEVQILDSFGLEGKINECGAIYGVAAPRVNACLPPLQWQTYDITFKAPRFDAAGNKIADAELTVEHNGVPVHDRVKVGAKTRAAAETEEAALGPLMLQDHGCPVQFRNIWVLPLKQE